MAKCYYEVGSKNYYILREKVKLPKFQRGLVWSEKMKRALINTIKDGLPFGALLLYKIKNEKYDYQLVDGLQRLSTVMDFENNRCKYFELKEVAKKELKNISSYYRKKFPTKLIPDNLDTIIERTIKDVLVDNAIPESKKSIAAKQKFKSELPGNDEEFSDLVQEKVSDIQDTIGNLIDLNDLNFPVVIFEGRAEDLPEVYDRVNSQGTKLSKYEIFSATWNNKEYFVKDDEILNWIDKRYKTIHEKSGLDIDGYDESSPILDSKKINLFEYAYAIGKIIHEKCGALFADESKNVNPSAIDSIGFALLVVCLGGKFKQTEKLPNFFAQGNSENMIDLKNKLVEVAQQVNEYLSDYIVTRDKKNVTKYIEAQVVSIIATLFKLKYIIEPDLTIIRNEDNKNLIPRFKRNMPRHYIYDLISEYWAGSGDRKASDILNVKKIEDNKYLSLIKKDSWRTVLREWLVTQNSKTFRNVPIINKLFLNYMMCLTDMTGVSFSASKAFDIEHIIPISRLTKKFGRGPFSALGNLCFLPYFDNRSKHDRTVYEDLSDKRIKHEYKAQVLIDKFYYPTRKEIKFIESNATFTYDNYIEFLKERSDFLIEKFSDIICGSK